MTMDIMTSWMAIKGTAKDTVLAAVGLRGTGLREGAPQSRLTGITMPNDWYLIVDNQGVPQFMEGRGLIRLSRLGEVVTGIVVSTEGYSVLERWHDGRLTWLVEHDASRGPDDLVIDAGPSFVWPIHRRVPRFSRRTGRPGVDTIPASEIPVMLSEALTGFRPDRLPAGFCHQPFEVLAAVQAVMTTCVDGFGRENWTYDTAT